jgi:hypothetical protein
VVELRTVGLEARLQVEDALEHLLHGGDVMANGGFAAELRLQVGRGRQVVRMGMGFKNPGYFEVIGPNVVHHLVSRRMARAAGLGVVVEYRVDDGAGRARPLVNNVGDGPSGLVKNAVDLAGCIGSVHGGFLSISIK